MSINKWCRNLKKKLFKDDHPYFKNKSYTQWCANLSASEQTSWRGEPLCRPGLRRVATGQRKGTWRRCAWEHSPCGWPHQDRWTDPLHPEKTEQRQVSFITVSKMREPFKRLCYWIWVSFSKSLSYLLATVWPVSEESEPTGHPAAVLEVSRQSAPRYDTPGTHSKGTFSRCDHTYAQKLSAE